MTVLAPTQRLSPTPPRSGDPPQNLRRAPPGRRQQAPARQSSSRCRGRVCSGRHRSPPRLSSSPRCVRRCKKTLRKPPNSPTPEQGVRRGAHPDHAADAQQAVPCLRGVGLGLLARKTAFWGMENSLFKKIKQPARAHLTAPRRRSGERAFLAMPAPRCRRVFLTRTNLVCRETGICRFLLN